MSSNHSKWPWHISGVLFGLVVGFGFVTGYPVGTATTYERVAGSIMQFLSPEYVANTAHYQQVVPVADWQVFFVIGIVVAGLIGRFLSGKREDLPPMWVERFGNDRGKRYWHAFIGGFFLLFGSRLAGGCTSGLFISGGSQLSLAAFVFAGGMFASGIITAKLLYKGRDV